MYAFLEMCITICLERKDMHKPQCLSLGFGIEGMFFHRTLLLFYQKKDICFFKLILSYGCL